MLHDLRAAFRSLLRSPFYVCGMLLLLGLGLGINLGLGQVMVRHLLHPFDAPEPERLVAPQIRHSLKLRGGSSSAHLFLTFQQEAKALPGVARAGLLDALPMEGSTWTSSFEADGADVMDGNHQAIALVHRLGGDAFGAMGLPLVAGRAPLPGEADTCVVSQALAALAWPGRDPIGHAVTLNKGPLRVVGVAQEMRFTGLRDSLMPQVYQPLRADVPTEFRVVLRGEGGDPRRFAAPLRELVKALDGSVSLTRIRPLESLVEGQLQDARNMGLLFGALALLALVLAALGLAGALSLGVSQRRPELGLRMALGAQMSQVVGLVLGQGLGQIALGLALGFPAAWGLGILLRSQLHGVLPGDLRATSAAALVLALTGLGAALIPALRAARVQPAETLRSE